MSSASNATSLFRSSAAGTGLPVTCCVFPRHFRVSSSSIFPSNATVVGGNKKNGQIAVEAAQSLEVDSQQPMNQEVVSEKMRQLREKIRWMLQNMDDGEISVSPYDTAWVAMVEDIEGGGGRPQFPTCLEWISNNQLDDGSWGDRRFFLYDRILNTLACVVALTQWKMHPHKCHKDAFKQFEKAGEFCSIPGQSTHAITGMYNLYRASQTMFNGEHILADAKNYSANFLHKKRLANAIVDKWIITKDLPGEVEYALDVPFYASLPQLEARFFLEQYGGDDDVWIGKTLYRMLYVNCDTYLELAKLDYKKCQVVHQLEWKSIQKWYRDWNLVEFGLSERSLLLAYYIAASTAFEPEKSRERMAWAKTTILVETITSQRQLSHEQKSEFVDEFGCGSILEDEHGGRLVEILINTISQLSSEILVAQGRDINQQLSNTWQKWLKTWKDGGDDLGEAEARLLLHTLHLSSGLDESSFSHLKYHQLSEATSNVCGQLRLFQSRKVVVDMATGTTFNIEAGMQELVKLAFTKSSEDLDSLTKQSFFAIARSFYYTAYCDEDAINSHIDKVLFEKID